jgi:hypothetical protein
MRTHVVVDGEALRAAVRSKYRNSGRPFVSGGALLGWRWQLPMRSSDGRSGSFCLVDCATNSITQRRRDSRITLGDTHAPV